MRKFAYVVIVFYTICVIIPLFAIDNEQMEVQNHKQFMSIIIDPGHGGRDHGAIGTHIINNEKTTFTEKDINLRIAYILKEKLEEIFPEKNIVLTRENDVFTPLEERTIQDNITQLGTNENSLFISIHTNASLDKNKRGFGFIVENIFDQKYNSHEFAEKILLEFIEIFGNELPYLGIMQNDSYFLRNAHGPAIIAEIGFITNLEDAILLYSEQGIEKISYALLNGIIEFIRISQELPLRITNG